MSSFAICMVLGLDSGCLYRDCFMYFQPRISFQPRVVLNREQGIFGVWGDMKIVTAWWNVFCFHRYLCPVCCRPWWIFLHTNCRSGLKYLEIIWNCLTKFQPRLTVFSTNLFKYWILLSLNFTVSILNVCFPYKMKQ